MPASIKGSANHRQTPLFLSDMSSSAVVSTGGIFARLSCRILLRCSENPFKPALKIVRDDAAVTLECRDVCPAPRYRYARLRDYARLGAMLANDGAWNGRQIISASYLPEATDSRAHPEHLAGYGYQFWILPGTSRQFAMRGLYGQMMLVHPAKRLVLVQTGVTKSTRNNGPNSIWPELFAVWQALIAATPDAKAGAK